MLSLKWPHWATLCWLFCSLSARGLCVGTQWYPHFPALPCAISVPLPFLRVAYSRKVEGSDALWNVSLCAAWTPQCLRRSESHRTNFLIFKRQQTGSKRILSWGPLYLPRLHTKSPGLCVATGDGRVPVGSKLN